MSRAGSSARKLPASTSSTSWLSWGEALCTLTRSTRLHSRQPECPATDDRDHRAAASVARSVRSVSTGHRWFPSSAHTLLLPVLFRPENTYEGSATIYHTSSSRISSALPPSQS